MNHIEDGIVAAADAQSLGGVAAESYALKTDVAPDSALLGGKAPEYYLQPRNLLDNSDFTNPVNQRGASSYTGNVYTIDRWALWWDGTTNGTLTINDDGITVTQWLFQNLENVDPDKEYTFAVSTANGLHVVSGKPAESATDGVISIIANGYVQVNVHNGGKLYWAALYEGVYTADTLPPYFPKGYAAELAECMRYYELVGVHKYSMGRIGEVYFDIQFTQKRISPTVTMALETASNNITNRGEVWNANRTSTGGLLYYVNDANMSYWYGSATVSADL